jgi:glycosyltransferase involved in cell wall biosynthesis
MIKLSLIIPVYNVEQYIVRCIKSIVDQSVDKRLYEIVVVDDGSPDNSIMLLQQYCKNIVNINIVSQSNRGLGGARNTGLANANGEYVWFIDSDDTITENSIARVLNEICSGAEMYVFDVNKISRDSIIQSSLFHSSINDLRGCDIVKYFTVGPVWQNVYKRDFLINNGLKFKEQFLHEDGEFNMRMLTCANRVSYRNFTIYNYYTSNSFSIMNNIKLRNQTDLLFYIQSAKEYSQCNDFNEQQKECLQKYLDKMLSVLFKNSIYLSPIEFVQFRLLLKQHRSDIYKIIKKQSFFKFLKAVSMLYFVSKRYYYFLYNKSLILS